MAATRSTLVDSHPTVPTLRTGGEMDQRMPSWFAFRARDWAGMLIALGLVTAAFGLFVGPLPALLLLGTLGGIALFLAAAWHPAVVLSLLCVAEFSNASAVVAVPGLFLGTLVLGATSVLLAMRDPAARSRLARVPLLPLLLVLVYLVSLLPAMHNSLEPDATATWSIDLLKDLALLGIILALGLIVERPWWIAGVAVLTLSVVGAMTIINQVALGAAPSAFGGFATVSPALGEMITTPRHAGPLPDSNFWGRNLILGLPLAYALVHRSGAAGRRLAQFGWGLTIVVLLVSIYLTQSRGTLLATLVVTAVWMVASGPQVRRGALLVVPLSLLLMLVPGVGNRLLNLDSIFAYAPAYTIDTSLVERAAAQKIAALVFVENPLFGTGPGSFKLVISQYAARAGNLLIGSVSAPHNLYLELAAEVGAVGLAGWLVLSVGMIALGVSAVLRLAGARPDGRRGNPTRALAAGVTAAVLGWSMASVFLHMAYLRPLLIIFALVVLVNRAGLRADGPPQALLAGTARAAHGLRNGLVRTVVVVLAVGMVTVPLLVGLRGERFSAQATFTLLPSPGTYVGYALDVRDREPVLPAYGAMLQSGLDAEEVRVDADPAKGLITMTGNGATRGEAEERLGTAIAAAPAALARFRGDVQYRLAIITPLSTSADRFYSRRSVAIVGLAVLLELLVIGGVAGVVRHRYRTPRR